MKRKDEPTAKNWARPRLEGAMLWGVRGTDLLFGVLSEAGEVPRGRGPELSRPRHRNVSLRGGRPRHRDLFDESQREGARTAARVP